MVFVPAVSAFLPAAQALLSAGAGARLLIKYNGEGLLSLKATNDVQVRSALWKRLELCSLLTPHAPAVRQTLTFRTKQKDDLKHLDKLSLHALTAATSAAPAPLALAAAPQRAPKAAAGSGAARRKLAAQARAAAGKGREGARTQARRQAREEKVAARQARRRERKEERALAADSQQQQPQ